MAGTDRTPTHALPRSTAVSGPAPQELGKPLLTADRLRELLDYDPATGVFRWRVSNGRRAVVGKIAGGVSESGPNGYFRIAIQNRRYYAHQLAWLYVHGEWPARHLDHLNTDKLDNRIANLRQVSPVENVQNQRRAHSQNLIGLLGVSARSGGHFVAEIKAGGVRRYLGTFVTASEAHAAYLMAKGELHPFGTLSNGASAIVPTRTVRSSKTGLVGVERKASGKFAAYFNRNGKRVRLGLYLTAEEAAEARKKAMMSN